MIERPSGTVTFLFTDVEGSTRLWEEHTSEMQVALERHDEILRTAIESRGGYVFSTAGDAFAASFARAGDALDAAVDAQRRLESEAWPEPARIRARMGLHTGEAQERDADYFGPVLNRSARVMSAGHGGQILVTAATAAMSQGQDLVDLGEHRLRDLSEVEHLFQVKADGLEQGFAPLRTVNATPGNLPQQMTSFVGRELEVKQLTELVRTNRLVTLTGFGGVGKTRLAVQTAAELIGEFGDGVWLVELAPVGDAGSVPDAVAAALGVTAQPGLTVAQAVAAALSGRRALVVLDNCEHVLDAAAALVELILGQASTVTVLATSREHLGVAAEHVWPVTTLDIDSGLSSPAVELFVARAQAVNPQFLLSDQDNTAAVLEICRRLDGIALAIELAAARMVSMSATDVRDRLDDRFRLLSATRRGSDRHHTLRAAVEWSYGLLNGEEQMMLDRCSVFSDGFDVAAAAHISGGDLDQYSVLDLLDSLVRKSLVTVEQLNGRTRYGLLETIRQFGTDRLVASGELDEARDLHARYFAEQACSYFEIWTGTDQRTAINWVDAEAANLRTGFQWATERGDLDSAARIAAHGAMLTRILQWYEPVGWSEEILDAAVAADFAQLPRLYTAASLCSYIGRPEMGVRYAQQAHALEHDPRYVPFEPGWSRFWEATANLYLGRLDRGIEIFKELSGGSGLGHANGLCGLLYTLPAVGQADEARAIADNTLTAARDYGNPIWIAMALIGYGRAFTETDPIQALRTLRECLDYTREHRLPFFEALAIRDAAALEARHGDPHEALALLDTAIDSFHRAGDLNNVGITLAHLATFFDRVGQPIIAATLYGFATRFDGIDLIIELPAVVDHLQDSLGQTEFDKATAIGADLEPVGAVRYARQQIQNTLTTNR